MRVSGNETEELSKAQANIEKMKMRHKSGTLSELRSMTNPPTMVKTTLESVCLLLGEKVNTWKSIKAVISTNNFLLNIIQLKTEDISDQTIQLMKMKYLSNPLYTVDHVARVNTACAPLVKWSLAHVTYAEKLREEKKGAKMDEAKKRDSLGMDEESLVTEEDSFELEEAAMEKEESGQGEGVKIPVENSAVIEVVEVLVNAEEETAGIEELIEPGENMFEATEEIIEEGIEEELLNIDENFKEVLKESNDTLLAEEEAPSIIETKEEFDAPVDKLEEPIIKKIDILCKEGDSIGNAEDSLGREV